MIGKVKLRKETLVMVYVCDITNLPFFENIICEKLSLACDVLR
jgi:hypothetical protein